MVLVLHCLYSTHFFWFKHELIFLVKLKTITIYSLVCLRTKTAGNQFLFEKLLQIPDWMLENSCINADELICHEPCWRVCQFWTVIEMNTREILSRAVGLFSLSIYSVICLILKTHCWLTHTQMHSSMYLLILFQVAIIIHFILQNLGFSLHYNKSKTKRNFFLVSLSSKVLEEWHLKGRMVYTTQRTTKISHF